MADDVEKLGNSLFRFLHCETIHDGEGYKRSLSPSTFVAAVFVLEH